MARKELGDVVVVVPGILGSELAKDGKAVWSMSAGGVLKALTTLGGSVKSLTLDGDDPSVDDLGDGVVATRLLPDLHLIPGLWTIDGYSKIREVIFDTYAVTEEENYFEFPYDWRRDNRVAGRKLAEASRGWLQAWRERSGNAEAKLILLCHSMGGLVARDFLERHEGWRSTRMLVTFGTPYRGSLNALRTLHVGFKKRVGPFTLVDLTDMARSLTSIYQLLPIYECYDPGTGDLLRVGETDGIEGVDPVQAAAALAFHHELRDLVTAHHDDAEYVEQGYGLHPIVGIDQPTVQTARNDGGKLRFSREYPGAELGGDGTVPQPSAFPLEMETSEVGTYSSEKHASLQNALPVLTQVRGLIASSKIDLQRFQAPPPFSPRLSLDVDDVFDTTEPLEVRARAYFGSPALRIQISDVDTGREAAKLDGGHVGDDGWTVFEIPPADEGVYRVTLGCDMAADTVTGIVSVFATDDS